MYPTGQNFSLELMFAKFTTAKNREKLNPLKVSSNRCICLKTTLKMCKIIEQGLPNWVLNQQPSDYKADFKADVKSDTL